MLLGIIGGDVESRSNVTRNLASALRDNENFSTVSDGTNADVNFDALEKLFRYRLLLHPGLEPENFSTAALVYGLRFRVRQVLAGGGGPA